MAGTSSLQKLDKALDLLFPHPDPAFLTRLEDRPPAAGDVCPAIEVSR